MDLHADIGAIWGAPDLDCGHKAVLTVVRYHADSEGNCRVTVDQIEAMTGLGRRTVIRRMADLVAMQIVDRMVDPRNGNLYRLNIPSSATQTPQGCHRDTPVVPQGHPSSATQTPQGCHTDTPRLIDVLCGSDVATRTTEPQEQHAAAAAAAAGAHAHERAPVDSGEVGGLIAAWWSTQPTAGRVPPAVELVMLELVAAHGPARVAWAIEAAREKTSRGAPSLGFMRKLAAEGPFPSQTRHAPRPAGGLPLPGPETVREWDAEREADAARRLALPLCPSCGGANDDCGAWARASPGMDAWVCNDGRQEPATVETVEMRAYLRPAREWRASKL